MLVDLVASAEDASKSADAKRLVLIGTDCVAQVRRVGHSLLASRWPSLRADTRQHNVALHPVRERDATLEPYSQPKTLT